jgi:cobalt-zinc-cadmium efflux system outer membrane protein
MQAQAHVYVWAIALSVCAPSVTAAQERTAQEVVEAVLRDGPQAAAARAGVEVVRREQTARLAPANPVVSYSREGAGFTEFLQVEQAVPVLGARSALRRAGAAAAAAAEAERDARLWLIRTDAADAAARLIAGQARAEVAAAYTADLSRVVDVLRAREREGEGSRFDRLRAEQDVYDGRRIAASALLEAADARAAVAAMLPPAVALSRVSGPLFVNREVLPADVLLARAATARSDIRALRAAGERAGLEAGAARRARLPVPTVSAGLKRADAGAARGRGAIVGVSVTVPLLDGGGREAARWSALVARLDLERTALEHEVRTEIGRAAETVALRQAAVLDDAEGLADELTRIAELAYREGEVGILELLDAFRTAARSRARSIDIRLDARLAQIALERAVGERLWP